MELIYKLICNMAFIFTATSTFYWLLNKNKTKRIKLTIFLSIIGLLLLTVSYYLYEKFNYGVITVSQFIYEIISIGILSNSIYINREKFKVKNKLSGNELKIFLISLGFGIAVFLILFASNYKYVFPISGSRHIGNMYFNADIIRAVNESFEFNLITSNIHPLYRYIMLPIMLPCMFLDEILPNILNISNLIILKACILIVIQIIFNSISAILFYKILIKSKINNKISILGTLLFIFSLPFIWLSIIPETYSITLLMLLLMILFYKKNNNLWIGFAVLTFGSNLMAAIPIGILLIDFLIKNYKSIMLNKKIKIILLILIAFLILFLSKIVLNSVLNYLNIWSDNTGSILEGVNNSINKFLIPMILGPEFINIEPFFVLINSYNHFALLIFITLIIISIIGFLSKFRKDVLVNVSFILLISGYILHNIIGYGRNNGIIYSPLYSWAFLILIINGFNFLYHKYKTTLFLIITIDILVLVFNINWIIDFSKILSKENFSEEKYAISDRNQIQLLYEDGKAKNFIVADEKIIQISSGETLVSNIDLPWVYNKENNSITGNTSKSKWFKIYISDNKLFVNLCEDVNQINQDSFFIFGMGLREKYLFVKDNKYSEGYYKLIRYSDKEEILNKLVLKNIDYENYKIEAIDSNNESVLIYENEEGIYLHTNKETKILDDSVKINIPTFEGYKNKRELRILFNEIMINITEEGPKPNFIAYENPWYRDAAIVAMALEETDNISQIENWILNIDSIYDMQNGVEEPANLGQVLFLISLTENRDNELIQRVLDEANKIKTEEGYINGLTDFDFHPVYQTKWLIFGLKSLGLDYSNYKIPDIYDSYENLLWFDKENNSKIKEHSDRWQYIHFASLHYNGTKIDFKHLSYPISYEYNSTGANFENLKIINENFANNKIIVPHSWSAAEMFLYLLYLDEVSI